MTEAVSRNFIIYAFVYPVLVFQLPHAFVNCVECFTLKLLLEQILNKLSHVNSSEAECPTEITCETLSDFVRLFKQVTSTENLKDQTVYIVSNLT